MGTHRLERKLRTALEHAAPNQLDRILSSCEEQNQAPGDWAGQTRTGARTQEVIQMPVKKKSRPGKRFGLAAAVAAAALLALCIGGVRLLRSPAAPAAAESVVILDVNPSLSMRVDSQETVLSVEALNEDAKEILGGMELKNTSLEVAVNAIIGSMLQKGYLGDQQNTILVSVENEDTACAEALQGKVSQIIQTAMETGSTDAAILSQSVSAGDEALAGLADEYGISLGKAALIQEVTAQAPELNFEDLAPMTINEIALIVSAKDVTSESITQNGTVSDKAYIGQTEALKIAYAHAGVDSAEVLKSKAEFDSEKGVMIYEVEFETAALKGEYEIDAVSGQILAVEVRPENGGEDGEAAAGIGEAAAVAAALNHAGVDAADVLKMETQLDREDGVMIYKVEFETADQKCQYRIDAGTGDVLRVESDPKDAGQKEHTPKRSDAESAGDDTAAASYIGEAAAQKAALEDAGVEEADTVYLVCYYQYGKGTPEAYCVEFAAGSTKYVYRIDLYTGEVLKNDTYTFHEHSHHEHP